MECGGGTPSERGERQAVYCIVPRDLAGKLHEQLRRHFRDDPGVEVVVERRSQERRAASDRREGDVERAQADRRSIRSRTGRRVADRRAVVLESTRAALPRRLERHADRLVFVERLVPSSLQQEDVDTGRLVSRFQAGERDVFAEIYVRYFNRVYGYLQVVLRNPHEAEEATQHVFAKVLESLRGYERRSQPFRGWLFVVVRNHALRQLHERARIEPVSPEEMDRTRSAEPEYEELPALEWISDRELMMFIERLPLAQRQVIVMRFVLEMNTREIADVLERDPGDIRMLQSRGLRFLRARLSAIGRGPVRRERRPGVGRRHDQAWVLRSRRFALFN